MLALGITLAAVAAFITSSVYYAVATPFERRRLGAAAPDRGRPAPWKAAVELLRTALLAGVFAWIAAQADLLSWPSALLLAVAMWVGFPLILLTGSVLWERVPVVTAVLHAGDWLLKLLLVGAVLGLLH
ncbi:DUF1761 domain-containing protein [Nonomuraea rubra]|uniref:DUF1761 domain-containing protein n=1 Tax=Nonomuraea rubra TaxID=46180 RepID=A0A7X0NWI6_9ACTN|nr:DUF1761 domain-containing protein [Nonomuraea rubra]MBB6550958.1 hypothetical protein [Nonomuraea rubra]